MRKLFVALAVVLAAVAVTPVAFGSTASIARELGPGVRVALHAQTGKVSFIGTTAGRPIARPAGLSRSASPEAVARAFLAGHGKLFGIANQARDLRLIRTQHANAGRSVVRFRQLVNGIPVLGGDLAVNLDAKQNILSVSGEATPGSVAAMPTVSAAAARRAAVNAVRKPSFGGAKASRPELWIYDGALIGAPGAAGARLVWRTDVTFAGRLDIRQLVLVDAKTGKVALQFNQVEQAKNRFICNAGNTATKVPCTSPYARTEGQAATGNADVDHAYDFAGIVYDFYKNRFNRDSIDNQGMNLLQTVKYCDPDPSVPCPYPNAFWNGTQMVYGDGYASGDDVVGHEMTHGVTERTSGLLYFAQSGAINESLSDTMGEYIDLTDGVGNDSPAVRWQMGEDLSIGAIRSMSNPPAFGDPDSMTSPNYVQSFSDNAGVHSNSGVNNKAAYLIADGGTFGGKTVTGLGIPKAAKIYYEVDANLLTSGSDYQDLAVDLNQACQNLVGTVVGASAITQANCTQVQNATAAVQMTAQPTGPAAVPEAPMCAAGQVPADLLYDNFESGAGKWMLGAPWILSTDWSATTGKTALYAEDKNTAGRWNATLKNAVALPAGKTIFFRFSHFHDLENDGSGTFYDGGVVQYSTNGGTTWSNMGSLPWNNGYNATIDSSFGNPLGGQRAFSDTSFGYLSSRVNISTLGGQSVKLRLSEGTDSSNLGGWIGWLVDDARLYTCATGTRPAASAANGLRNAGMEWDDNDDGFADVWSANAGALRMDNLKHSGRYSIKLGKSAAAGEQPYSISQKVAAVPVTGGSHYSASGWFDIPGTASGVNAKLQVAWLNASGATLVTSVVKAYTAHTTGWNQALASPLVAPTGAVAARVSIVQGNPSVPVYVDDVNFKAAP